MIKVFHQSQDNLKWLYLSLYKELLLAKAEETPDEDWIEMLNNTLEATRLMDIAQVRRTINAMKEAYKVEIDE